jgi:hypothetical protein
MGWFDWYEPRITACPECSSPLSVWQGKDGPCGLFVWQQGTRTPIRQAVDAEVALSPERLAHSELPPSFAIYSYDCPNHVVEANGRCVNGVWSATEVTEVNQIERRGGRAGGIVWIAPEVDFGFPTDRPFDPEHSLFWTRWEVWNDEEQLEHDENEAVLGAEAAIRWGSERADTILIRLSGNGPYYSAGRFVRSHDLDGSPIRPWPPDTPVEGWWRPPERFIHERLQEWRTTFESED